MRELSAGTIAEKEYYSLVPELNDDIDVTGFFPRDRGCQIIDFQSFKKIEKTTTTISGNLVGNNDWILNTLFKLDEISKLPDNWDGYGGLCIKNTVVEAANCLLLRLGKIAEIDMPDPFVAPIAEGTFQFEWSLGNKYLEFEFINERTLSFLKEETISSGQDSSSNELPIDRIDEIQKLLNWLVLP